MKWLLVHTQNVLAFGVMLMLRGVFCLNYAEIRKNTAVS